MEKTKGKIGQKGNRQEMIGDNKKEIQYTSQGVGKKVYAKTANTLQTWVQVSKVQGAWGMEQVSRRENRKMKIMNYFSVYSLIVCAVGYLFFVERKDNK